MKFLPNTDILLHPASEPFEDPLTTPLEISLNWLWRVTWLLHPKHACYCWSKSAGTMAWLCSSNSMHMHFILPQFFLTCSISTALVRWQWEAPWCSTETGVAGNTGYKESTLMRNCPLFLQISQSGKISTVNWHHKQTLLLTIFIQIEGSPDRGIKMKAKN